MADMKKLVIDGIEYEIIDASVRIRMTDAESDIAGLQTGKADNEDVPTNTSDLNNDAGFITEVPVTDVTIDGSSVLSGTIAEIPRASANAAGAVKIDPHTAADAQYLDIYAEKSGDSEVARKVPLLDANNKILATQLPAATTSTQGAMSAADKTKLNGAPSDVQAYVDDGIDPAWESIMDNGVAKLPIASPERYGGIRFTWDDYYATLHYAETDDTEMSVYVPVFDSETEEIDPACLPAATTSVQGAMSAADKTKLDGIDPVICDDSTWKIQRQYNPEFEVDNWYGFTGEGPLASNVKISGGVPQVISAFVRIPKTGTTTGYALYPVSFIASIRSISLPQGTVDEVHFETLNEEDIKAAIGTPSQPTAATYPVYLYYVHA